ncbi:MAG TPA: hypothetical protein VGH28_02175 [Polyangiaceae bacterium]
MFELGDHVRETLQDGLSESDVVERRVRDCERRLANLTDALAKVGWSEALANKLRDEESHLAKLKAERAATARDPAARAVPDRATIARYVKNLFTLLETDAVRGREILSRFVAPIVMTPKVQGSARHYRATGAFNLSFFLAAESSRSGKVGCAGRI